MVVDEVIVHRNDNVDITLAIPILPPTGPMSHYHSGAQQRRSLPGLVRAPPNANAPSGIDVRLLL